VAAASTDLDWPAGGPPTRPPKPRTPWTVWAGIAAAVVITAWAVFEPLGGIGFTLAPLFGDDLIRGRRIIAEFLAPNWVFLGRIWEPFLETFLIAVIAAVVGVAAALPLAIMATRISGVGRTFYAFMRGLNSVIRSLPDIAWGLLAVAAVGSGALAGIVALIFFNIGVMVKLTSETVDAIDVGPLEAANASGATRTQTAWQSIVPQILPNYLSYGLYVFELNIRASVVIGFVGGGGIGNVLNVQLALFNYGNISVLIIVLFAVVYIIDRISIRVRRRLV
jgi:phosphonate transport system permease protein